MNKQEYVLLGSRYETSFCEIAKALGPDHTITQMLGPLAWGRHDWELGPHPLLPQAIRRSGALEGYFAAINMWARDHDRGAQVKILQIWHRKSSPQAR